MYNIVFYTTIVPTNSLSDWFYNEKKKKLNKNENEKTD